MATSPASGPGGGGLTAPATIGPGAVGVKALDLRVADETAAALTLSNDTLDPDPNDPIGEFYAEDNGDLFIATHSSGQKFTIRATDGLLALIAGSAILNRTGNSAPADALLSAGDFALWLDATIGATKLMVKAKDSGGTVRSAAIALS